MENKRNHFVLTIWHKIGACLLGSFALLLLLIPYVEAAPPLGGVSPTPPPVDNVSPPQVDNVSPIPPQVDNVISTPPPVDITPTSLPDATSTLINLSVTKEAVSPADSDATTDMPTALPAVLAAATRDSALWNSPLDLNITIMSSGETSDAIAANRQDDEWRASAAAQGMAYCVRGTLSDSDPNTEGINDTRFADGVTETSISYSLRDLNGGVMGSVTTGEEQAQGVIKSGSFMKEAAPVPQELLDLGQAAAFEEQVGSTDHANGLLFTFSSPGVRAFGAWFGGLESRAPLEGGGIDGDPRGGKLAYMRLFDAEGRIIGPDRPIRPAQKEGESLCLDANDQPIECGTANTRWIGFLASQPVAQMLLVVGDNDDSDEHLTCRVAADGGTEADFIAQCQAGDEHLSFVGPTICTETMFETVAVDLDLSNHETETNNNNHDSNHDYNSNDNESILIRLLRERPMQSLALTGIGVSLLGFLAFLWRKRD